MKRLAYILILVVVLGLALTSCNRKANCPAYKSHMDQEQPANPRV